MALPELPWNNLVEFVKDYTKGLQELVDSVAPDPGADNSMFAIEPLYEFDCCIWYKGKVRFVTDQFNNGQHGNGYQGLVYTSRITLQNNVLHVQAPTYMGKGQPAMDWNGYSADDYEVVKSVAENITMGIRNNYSDNDIVVHANQYGNVYFQPSLHNKSDIGLKYTEMENERSSSEFNIQFQNITLGWENDYVTNSTSLGDLGTGAVTLNIPVRTAVIAVIRNDNEASNLVSVFSPYNTHNQVLQATSQGSYKIYYGDNYIIYSIPSGTLIKYNDIFNATNTVAGTINGWNPSAEPIVVPTYKENKYGPEPTDDDDIDNQVIGAGANLGSIARLWLLTRQQLIDLHDAFANAPANYDPLTSFIGVLGFGVQPIKVVGDSLPWTLNPVNIRMSNGELWHTGVEGHIIDSQVSAFSFPDIHIKKRYNNFLDYSPYATHEIFIPMCGWLTLPDIAVDRSITVTYLPDLESMRCRAIVSVVDDEGDKCVIGVKDGIMGAEVPFTNLNHSVWLANLITNAADVTGEMVTGAIGAGFTKTTAKGATYRPYEGFTIGMAGGLPGAVGNALLSGNVNRTHVVGSNGNRTGFSDGENIMVKSVYHQIDKPENYDHTIGKVCNKTGQLSEFHGFTVCDNPHINISALDEEKEEIKRLLEEGVILPDGE